jgi:hypothetical protein
VSALFVFFAILAGVHAQWVTTGAFLAVAAVYGFMTWLRYSRNQPVPFMAALLGLMGRKAVPPKSE